MGLTIIGVLIPVIWAAWAVSLTIFHAWVTSGEWCSTASVADFKLMSCMDSILSSPPVASRYCISDKRTQTYLIYWWKGEQMNRVNFKNSIKETLRHRDRICFLPTASVVSGPSSNMQQCVVKLKSSFAVFLGPISRKKLLQSLQISSFM